MDKSLKEQYMQAMMRFRKICMILPQRSDLNMTELIVMKGIARNSSLSDNNTTVSEIQSKLHITKSAISQMMNSLEKKGYIKREIDKADRRKVIVTLTKVGKEVWKETKESADNNLEEFISRLGDEKTKQLIPQNAQISKHFFENDDFYLKETESIFAIKEEWIALRSSSLRRRDWINIYET